MDDIFAQSQSRNPLIEKAWAQSDGSRSDFLDKLQKIVQAMLGSSNPPSFSVLSEAIRELTPDVQQTPSEILLRDIRDSG